MIPRTFIARQLAPLDLVTFDTIEGLIVEQPKTATKHPTEIGSDTTDHVQVHNLRVAFRGYVSDTPALIPGVLPVESAKLFFELIGGALVIVSTPQGVFRDMVVIAAPYDYRGSVVAFDLQLEQLRLASPISVPIPPRQPVAAAQAGAASAQDAGTQTPIPIDDPADSSVAVTGLNAITGLFQ